MTTNLEWIKKIHGRTDYLDSALYRTTGAFAGDLVLAENTLCPDGQRRNAWPTGDGVADTFFSIPAFVYVGNHRVYGYVTMETSDGFTTESFADKVTVKFVPYYHRKHHALVEWNREKIEKALDSRQDVRWWDTGVRMDTSGEEPVPTLVFILSLKEGETTTFTYDEVCHWLYLTPDAGDPDEVEE